LTDRKEMRIGKNQSEEENIKIFSKIEGSL
jgi:hypothetical protein